MLCFWFPQKALCLTPARFQSHLAEHDLQVCDRVAVSMTRRGPDSQAKAHESN